MDTAELDQTAAEVEKREDWYLQRAGSLPWWQKHRIAITRSLRQWGYGTGLYNWRLKGRHPVRLLASPDDPWPGTFERGEALLTGKLAYAGTILSLDRPDFWQKATDLPAIASYMHSFSWLRDLAQIGNWRGARDVAEDLVRTWLDHFSDWHIQAWTPEMTGRRLCMWYLHAPLILSSKDLVYRSAVLHAMGRQTRHLMRVLKDAKPGPDQLDAAAGLILSGLLLPDGAEWRRSGETSLSQVMRGYILPDGGPLSRRPADSISIIKTLVLIRSAYEERSEPMPDEIQHMLDKMAPFLRSLRHGDGSLMHINGAGKEDISAIDRLLYATHARGRPIEIAPYWGLARLKAARTLLLFDMAPPPHPDDSSAVHAGVLSFELSDGKDRIIVNIGSAAGEMSDLGRTSAAHSTLILGDRNSTQVRKAGLGKGVEQIAVERIKSDAGTEILARHDGYLTRLKSMHERRLFMRRDGAYVRGKDSVIPIGTLPGGTLGFAIRFHLHPDVSASLTHGGQAVLLRLSNRHGWLFSTEEKNIVLEDSVYCDGQTLRRTQQIVINGTVGQKRTNIAWSFERLGSSAFA